MGMAANLVKRPCGVQCSWGYASLVTVSKTPKKRSPGENLAEYGWHVAQVFSEDNSYPPFAYTIGLEAKFDHPEVVIFGLNNDLDFMHRVLNGIGSRVEKGEHFLHGSMKKGILPGYTCAFARFPKSAYEDHLGRAIDHYDGKFRCVQCIWPDPKKKLPWDPRVMLPTLSREPVFLRPDAGPRDPKWPFDDSQSRLVFVTRQVATGAEPIRFAGRFAGSGEWQFVCNTTSDPQDLLLATLGWALDHDRSVAAIAGLRPGQCAERKSAKKPWKRSSMPDE